MQECTRKPRRDRLSSKIKKQAKTLEMFKDLFDYIIDDKFEIKEEDEKVVRKFEKEAYRGDMMLANEALMTEQNDEQVLESLHTISQIGV